LAIVEIFATNAQTMNKNPTPNVRWFKDQLKARDLSQNQLGRKLGLDRGTMSRFLSGKRALKIEEANRMADILQVPLEEVLSNSGIAGFQVTGRERKASMEITGWVDDQLAIHHEPPRGPKSAPMPPQGGKGIRALRFQTASSQFDGMDGGLVYYQESTSVIPESIGRLCVVKLTPHPRRKGPDLVLRNVKRSYESGKFNLYLLNGALAEESVQIDSASPVIWLKL
jgi:transcriptional regulator with XRE-family HTH domain